MRTTRVGPLNGAVMIVARYSLDGATPTLPAAATASRRWWRTTPSPPVRWKHGNDIVSQMANRGVREALMRPPRGGETWHLFLEQMRQTLATWLLLTTKTTSLLPQTPPQRQYQPVLDALTWLRQHTVDDPAMLQLALQVVQQLVRQVTAGDEDNCVAAPTQQQQQHRRNSNECYAHVIRWIPRYFFGYLFPMWKQVSMKSNTNNRTTWGDQRRDQSHNNNNNNSSSIDDNELGVTVLPSPWQMLDLLRTLSWQLSEFNAQYNDYVVGHLMDVLAHVSSRNDTDTPERLEHLLARTQADGAVLHNDTLRNPTVHVRNRVLQAWITSARSDGADFAKIRSALDRCLDDMRTAGATEIATRRHNTRRGIRPDQTRGRPDPQRRLAPNAVSYSIYLRFLNNHPAAAENEDSHETTIASVFAVMEQEALRPTIACLAQAVYGLTRVTGHTSPAEEYFGRLVSMTPSNRDEVNGVFESAQHLLVAYRDSLDNDEAEWSRREAVVVAAEHVYRRVRKRSFPCVSADDEAYRRLDGSLADIYARVGRGQEAQELLLPQDFPVDGSSTLDDVDKSAHDNPVATTIRMKTFAKDEAAEKATQLLLQQFHNNPASEAMPNLFTFATAMNAWAESTRPDAFDQAFELFHLLDECPVHN